MTSSLDPSKKRKPRIAPEVRTKIVQLRASNEDHPLSLDAILNKLADEGHFPSRGTVQNIVRAWEDLPSEVRQRDLPFNWHRLDRARIPWEGSRAVLDCLYSYQRYVIRSAREMEAKPIEGYSVAQFLRERPVFTNRWATWCWRVSQALPDWGSNRIVLVAGTYAQAEQAEDLLPNHPPMEVAAYDTWLAFRPYQVEKEYWTERISEDKAIEYGSFYLEARRLGIASAIPEPDVDLERGWELEAGKTPPTSASDAAKALWIAQERDLLLTAWLEEYVGWDWESNKPQRREE